MTEADVPAVSAIRVTGWQTAYAGIVPRSYLDGLTVEADVQQRRRHFERPREGTTNLVAVDAHGQVVGWACFGRFRGDGASTAMGELYALYVQPSRMGSGVGRVLLEAVHARARADGRIRVMLLWVLTHNTRARRFYERAGYAADGAVQADDYDGVSVPEVRYRRILQVGDSGTLSLYSRTARSASEGASIT
jgi:L-amino acid N-acyltransferase YncA